MGIAPGTWRARGRVSGTDRNCAPRSNGPKPLWYACCASSRRPRPVRLTCGATYSTSRWHRRRSGRGQGSSCWYAGTARVWVYDNDSDLLLEFFLDSPVGRLASVTGVRARSPLTGPGWPRHSTCSVRPTGSFRALGRTGGSWCRRSPGWRQPSTTHTRADASTCFFYWSATNVRDGSGGRQST